MPNTTSPTFTHRPRPAHIQRRDICRFGQAEHITTSCGTVVSTLRVVGAEYASVVVRSAAFLVGAALTPEQARELAAALIDVAHDIESHPAAPAAAAAAAEGGAA